VGLYEFLGDIQSHVDLRVLGWQGIYNESEAGDNAGADFGPSYRPLVRSDQISINRRRNWAFDRLHEK
jgi:hypothetical protein